MRKHENRKIENEWLAFANDLEGYLDGKVTADEIRSRWENVSPDIDRIMYNVNHLLADEDIRDKDDEYKEMQYSEARKLINALREKRDIEEILKISFLQRT